MYHRRSSASATQSKDRAETQADTIFGDGLELRVLQKQISQLTEAIAALESQ